MYKLKHVTSLPQTYKCTTVKSCPVKVKGTFNSFLISQNSNYPGSNWLTATTN